MKLKIKANDNKPTATIKDIRAAGNDYGWKVREGKYGKVSIVEESDPYHVEVFLDDKVVQTADTIYRNSYMEDVFLDRYDLIHVLDFFINEFGLREELSRIDSEDMDLFQFGRTEEGRTMTISSMFASRFESIIFIDKKKIYVRFLSGVERDIPFAEFMIGLFKVLQSKGYKGTFITSHKRYDLDMNIWMDWESALDET